MTTRAKVLAQWFGLTFLVILLSSLLPARVQHSSVRAGSADGLWLSDGYGLLLEIEGNTLQAFEVTSISCLPSWSGRRVANDVDGPETTFRGDAGTVHVSTGATEEVTRMHRDGTVSDVVLQRISARPKACGSATKNTPQASYAIFWQTFAEHYPFFELHHVDWRAMDRKWRPQVTPATTSEELFGILRQMIEPLQDAHTGLAAPDISRDFDGWRAEPGHLDERDWKKANDIIAFKYLHGGLRFFCKGRMQFGILEDSIGYLRIIAFYGYTDTEAYGDTLEALKLALDAVFAEGARLTGLVIDLRLNKGGDDALGLEIASRLASRRYLAYAKAARNNLQGPVRFTAPQEAWVVPSTRPGFQGIVVLLTGPDTVSAGETFTMALMGRDPHVTRVGLNTQGVFSDVLSRRLPNGWRFRLSNEIYFTSDRKSFDGSGVPPEIHISFFSTEDIQRGRDSALEMALKILRTRRGFRAEDRPIG